MLSIGELAQRTGVSRRMLRHWEASGLLSPARVDSSTGHRRYLVRQTGRVRAIAALRSAGYRLETIGDLLSGHITEERLIDLLHQREKELEDQVTEASARLHEVRSRLESIEKGRTVMITLELSSLPALMLAGVREDVADETEIPDAVSRLLDQLPTAGENQQDVHLVYDGSTDASVIIVSAGVVDATLLAPAGPGALSFAAAERAASVTYPEPPSNVGDAWVAIDAELERHQLQTTGPYRQTLHADRRVTLAAPVVALIA